MRLLRFGVIVAVLFALLLSLFPAMASGQDDRQGFAPDRLLVKFKPSTDEVTKQDIHRKNGSAVIAEIREIGVQVLRVPAGRVPEKLAAYRAERAIEFAEPDFIAEAIETPNDPYFAQQWGMTKIQAPQAWDVTTGKPDIWIAILDTGIDQDHQDLPGLTKIVANANFTFSLTWDDIYGHGTHVAGIAAAATNNGIGVAGVGRNSGLINVKVLGDNGSGYYSWVASGITWAANYGAKVINMSLGGPSASSALEDAVNYAWGKGVVVVAAAGNSSSSALSYPAAYDNCIAVAATTATDTKASFSNYGSWVDVAAPGVSIYSTLPNHPYQLGTTLNYGSLSGTSMAAPHVAGLAGLVWATPYGTSNASVRNRIESTADAIPGTGTYWQYGRINAYRAVLSPLAQPPSLSVGVSAPSLTNETTFAVQATVSNTGDETATGVSASMTLPSGLTTAESLTKSLGDIKGKGSAITSWVVTATSDSTYSVTVEATAANAPSASDSAVLTVDTMPPSQVTGLVVTTVSSSQLNLTWTANAESDLAGYRVYRSNVSGSSYTLVASPATNSYQDSGRAPATTYYYVVSAVDKAGNEGAKSLEASGTTSPSATKKMHVESIDMGLKTAGKNVSALATVTIVDELGKAVPGATVSGQWSGATSDSDAGVTDSSGRVTLQSNFLKRPPSGTTFTFTVGNVVLAGGWTYDATANVETSDSITV